jgi:phosphoribosylformylglycinamidine cyclo-ligase
MGNEMYTYAAAGVNKTEGYRSVALMKELVKATYNTQVLNELGSFGAFYELPANYQQPVLVSGTDGVGTKVKIAQAMQQYDTIGIDCVAMCVNDILCHGAKPLFFLDYLACSKLNAATAAQIVTGMTAGCIQAGAALIGGETAEMPGVYELGTYDIAGFAVGIVDKNQIITGSNVVAGDVIIGLDSSGLHSNGFSLVRQLIPNLDANFQDTTIGRTLLRPTIIYVKPILTLLKHHQVHGLAHITGGGIIENVPRIVPDGLTAIIDTSKLPILPIFTHIMKLGVPSQEMFNTFNMGIGFVVIAPATIAADIINILSEANTVARIIGHIEDQHCSTEPTKICLR